MEHKGNLKLITEPVSLQLMNRNCKPFHVRAYTVSRSLEQQSQKSKETLRLMEIGVLEEDYSSELSSQKFVIPKKK
jgi:hypothetical protein